MSSKVFQGIMNRKTKFISVVVGIIVHGDSLALNPNKSDAGDARRKGGRKFTPQFILNGD